MSKGMGLSFFLNNKNKIKFNSENRYKNNNNDNNNNNRSCTFSRVRPFNERGVSNLDP